MNIRMLQAKYYTTKKEPPFINERLTSEEWLSYVGDYSFGTIPPTRLVLHHTWKPTVEEWRGLGSMEGMQTYYKGLGWSAGPHLYSAPDGIWLATPLKDVGIHANTGNGSIQNKWYSIGIEMVGNYDKVQPSGAVWEQTVAILGSLLRKLTLPVSKIDFHRDYNKQKSCPGWAVTKPWVYEEVTRWLVAHPSPSDVGMTVVAAPRISKKVFLQILNRHSSPALPEGPQIYDIFITEGIDPGVALAFFVHESSCGRAGVTAIYDLKNWGNVRTPEDPLLGTSIDIPRRGKFTKYDTWSLGALDWCRRIKGSKYAGSGLTTIETIIPKYAPTSDGNAPSVYIQTIKNAIAAWQTFETV